MKVISGILKGRKVDGYDIEGTRPTMDRVRESLFGVIQMNLPDSSVLDLFAGSGILGFEAYSNGAKYIHFNDSNPICIKNIKENINLFNMKENAGVSILSYQKCLEECLRKNEKFDLIFLDPPYHLECFQEIIDFIEKNNLLNSDGMIVFEYDHEYNWKCSYSLYRKKKYGNKYIEIYQNRSLK